LMRCKIEAKLARFINLRLVPAYSSASH
jgi:hypothetical protein